MATAARSHRTITRVQRIEAALPSLEKSVLAQTSHIHFAYTPGMLLILVIGALYNKLIMPMLKVPCWTFILQ